MATSFSRWSPTRRTPRPGLRKSFDTSAPTARSCANRPTWTSQSPTKASAGSTSTITGRAAHGSRPDLGVDAITKTGAFLQHLDQLAGRLSRGPAHPVLGPGGVHAGVIRGGQETSSYPETCTVSVERRTVPGETIDTTLAELGQLLHEAYRDEPDVTYRLVPGIDRQPFSARPDSPIVAALLDTITTVLGAPASTRGEAFWTDCALLAEAEIDTVLFGVSGGGAHAATEWVDIGSLHQVTEVLTALTARYCA